MGYAATLVCRAIAVTLIATGFYITMSAPKAQAALPISSINTCGAAAAAINAALTGVARNRLALKAANKSHQRTAITRAKKRLAAAEAQRDAVRAKIKALCAAGVVTAQAGGCSPAIDDLAATIDQLASARVGLAAVMSIKRPTRSMKGARRLLESSVRKLENAAERQSDAMQAACDPAPISGGVNSTDAAPEPVIVPPDTTAPIVAIGVQSPTNDATPHVNLSANESGVTYTCLLDGAPLSTPSASFDLPTLSLSAHSFKCSAGDPAGNIGPLVTVSILIDMTAPAAPSVGGPTGPTALRIVSGFVVLLGDPGNRAECRVDDGPYSPANQSSYTATFSTAGEHRVFCHLIDAAGNVGPDGTPDQPIIIL